MDDVQILVLIGERFSVITTSEQSSEVDLILLLLSLFCNDGTKNSNESK